ncbi:MAG: YceI family protein [Acidimicrobiales bacterium]
MTDHHDAPAVVDAPEPAPARSHRLRWLSLGIVGVGLAAAGVVAWTQVKPVVDARRYASVTYEVPEAPHLSAGDGELLLRIDPTASSLTYEVDETFVGKKTSTATGVTNGIAGDIALNRDDLAASRVGDIVANVEQFHSDNNLRDARIRQDFLESHRYPLATFSLDEVKGLDGTLEEGRSYSFTLEGSVAIKDTTAPVAFDVDATFADGRLTATATTTAKLSRFDAGPISIAGLVRTEDDVALTLELTAVDPSRAEVATEVAGPERVDTKGAESPSFRTVVAPILEQSCANCHNTGQMAGKHVRIDTAADAKAISDGIKTVTQTGYMPPWPASDKGVELAHVPRLSPSELQALAAWADAGGPLDVPASTKLEMTAEVAAQQPRKDVSLRIPSYTGVATNTNDYRCFVLDPEVTEDTILTGYTFLADQVEGSTTPGVPHQRRAGGQRREAGWRRRPTGVGVLRRSRPRRSPPRSRARPAAASRRRLRRPGQPRGRLGAGSVAGDLPRGLRGHAPQGRRAGDAAALPLRRCPHARLLGPGAPARRPVGEAPRAAGGEPARPGGDPLRPRGRRRAAVRPRRIDRRQRREVRAVGRGQRGGAARAVPPHPRGAHRRLRRQRGPLVVRVAGAPGRPDRGRARAHAHARQDVPAHVGPGHRPRADPPRHPPVELRLADELRPGEAAAGEGRPGGAHGVLVGSPGRPEPRAQVRRVRRGHRGRDVLRHLRPRGRSLIPRPRWTAFRSGPWPSPHRPTSRR